VVKYTSYAVPLASAIDTMLKTAQEMNIKIDVIGGIPLLYYGDYQEYPPPPNIYDLLKEQADRIGFQVATDTLPNKNKIQYLQNGVL
jgi:hypothetical protein